MAKEEGYECDVTMLAHGGWYLHQHVKEPDIEMYDEDGAHASEHGIEFAAKIIWSTIETDFSHGK